jgi:hypothetical protein
VDPRSSTSRWEYIRALFRVWMGLAQMAGATISLVLLVRTGLNGTSLAAAGLTTFLSLLSRVLFKKQRPLK